MDFFMLFMLIMPSFLGTNFYTRLIKKEIKGADIFVKYGTINFLTNLSVLGYLILVKEYGAYLFSDMISNLGFCIQYIIVASLCSLVIGLFLAVIEKNVVVDVEVKTKKKSK